jgi:hypothetical protein
MPSFQLLHCRNKISTHACRCLRPHAAGTCRADPAHVALDHVALQLTSSQSSDNGTKGFISHVGKVNNGSSSPDTENDSSPTSVMAQANNTVKEPETYVYSDLVNQPGEADTRETKFNWRKVTYQAASLSHHNTLLLDWMDKYPALANLSLPRSICAIFAIGVTCTRPITRE